MLKKIEKNTDVALSNFRNSVMQVSVSLGMSKIHYIFQLKTTTSFLLLLN